MIRTRISLLGHSLGWVSAWSKSIIVNIAALLLGRQGMPLNDTGINAHIILGGISALQKHARIRVFCIIIIYHRLRSDRSGSGRKDVLCWLVNAAWLPWRKYRCRMMKNPLLFPCIHLPSHPSLVSDKNHETKQGHYPFDIEVVTECRYGLINPLGHYRTFLSSHQNILSEK